MNKENYIKSLDKLQISPELKERTAKLMKEAKNDSSGKPNTILNHKQKKYPVAKKLALTFASAAVIISAGLFITNYNNLFSLNDGTNINSQVQGITVPAMELPSSGGAAARMRPLFVYQGRIYLHDSGAISTLDGYTVSQEDMLNLRGDYLGKTTGSLDEWSKQADYATEFASTIGDSDVYTVNGYDSNHRLMVYSEYEGGFTCDIYDSFGGATLTSGADYFGMFNLTNNISSFQWESYDSWNNGKSERTDASIDDVFNTFIDKLYTATPLGETSDLLTESTNYDSQKFIYLKTKDNLITTVRLFKEGYVYAPEVGYFKVDQTAFDAFWNTMPVVAP